MPAAIIDEKGSPLRLGNFAAPQVTPGHCLINVIAGGIGPTDLMRANGFFGPTPYPYVPGGEGVGKLEDGRRVYFGHAAPSFGALSRQTIGPAEEVWPLPDDIADGLAIALGVSGIGALIPLEEARIQPGES